jgi:hypothetical protein
MERKLSMKEYARRQSVHNSDDELFIVPWLARPLLDFYFAVRKHIAANAAYTYIIPLSTSYYVISAAAQDAVVSASSIDDIRACAANDEIIDSRTCQCAGAADDVGQVQ